MSYLGNTPELYNFVAGADQFSGNASQTIFTLTRRIGTVHDVIPVIENVIQDPFVAYTVSANTTSGTSDVTFSSAPPSGSNNIVVNYRATQIVSYNIVTEQQLQANSVTTSKIVDGAITAAKIADGTIIAADIADGSVTTAKIADANVTTAKLSTTGVVAGTYGGSSNVSVVTVGADGRVTFAANVAFLGGGGDVTKARSIINAFVFG